MIKSLNQLAKRLLGSQLFRSSSMVSLVTVFSGIVGYIFNMVLGTMLTKGNYGEYFSLIYSLFGIITLPVPALQLVMGKDISGIIHKNDMSYLRFYIRKIFKLLIVFLLATITLLAVLLPFMKKFLNFDNYSGLILVILMIPLAYLTIPLIGLLQSRERFNSYVVVNILSSLVKIASGISLVIVLRHYAGAIYGLIASQLTIFIYLSFDYFRYRDLHSKRLDLSGFRFDYRSFFKSFSHAFLALGAFTFINSLDILLVKHFMNSDDSGTYGMMRLLGSATLYISMAVAFIFLPRLAKEPDKMHSSNLKGLSYLLVLLGAFAIFLIPVTPLIVRFILPKYRELNFLLPLFGFMYIPFPAIYFLINYYAISQKFIYSLTILIGSIFITAGIIFFHSALWMVCLVVGFSGYLIFGALIFDMLVLKRKKPVTF